MTIGMDNPERRRYPVLSPEEMARKELARVKTELVIANAKLEALEKERGIDPLTGISNRLFLEKTIEKLITELNFLDDQRQSAMNSLMVIALDINKFKVFNEKPFNHAVGDKAIIAFTERLGEITKKGRDILFRLGGDEFLIVMPILEANPDFDFEKLFFDIKERVNKDLLVPDVENAPKITASMGFSILKRGEKKTAVELLKEVDEKEREEKIA